MSDNVTQAGPSSTTDAGLRVVIDVQSMVQQGQWVRPFVFQMAGSDTKGIKAYAWMRADPPGTPASELCRELVEDAKKGSRKGTGLRANALMDYGKTNILFSFSEFIWKRCNRGQYRYYTVVLKDSAYVDLAYTSAFTVTKDPPHIPELSKLDQDIFLSRMY